MTLVNMKMMMTQQFMITRGTAIKKNAKQDQATSPRILWMLLSLSSLETQSSSDFQQSKKTRASSASQQKKMGSETIPFCKIISQELIGWKGT